MADETSKQEEPIELGQLDHTTGFLVRRLHNSLVSSWKADIVGPASLITPVQAGVLILIAENPGVMQARLLKVLDVESATLVKSITRLAEFGYIERVRNPDDKRAFHLYLTPSGQEALKFVAAKMREREEGLRTSIDPAEYEVFRKVLLQLIRSRLKTATWL
ncbi:MULTISPECIES: winged helix DNA-binding protein [Chelativorans]|uniref:Transcriptional regulator, MarR family n=1 Tax=Chelativorans sp. (strain BNC1) TaxID=266779 RepID=Q11JD9_CHESB